MPKKYVSPVAHFKMCDTYEDCGVIMIKGVPEKRFADKEKGWEIAIALLMDNRISNEEYVNIINSIDLSDLPARYEQVLILQSLSDLEYRLRTYNRN